MLMGVYMILMGLHYDVGGFLMVLLGSYMIYIGFDMILNLGIHMTTVRWVLI